MAAYSAELTRALFVTGLHNAHAVEQQALTLKYLSLKVGDQTAGR